MLATNRRSTRWVPYALLTEFMAMLVLAIALGGLSLYSFYTACLWACLPFAITLGVEYMLRWQRLLPIGMVLSTLVGLYAYSSVFRESAGRGPGLAIVVFQLLIAWPYICSTPEIKARTHLFSYLILYVFSHLCTALVLQSIVLY